MLLVESVDAGKDNLKLKFDNGSVLDAGTAYLPAEYLSGGAVLGPGVEIDAETEAALRFAAECLSVEKAALRLVARAEQCEKGLERKLRQRKYPAGPVRAVLERLAELDLVNDSRFAELWLKYRVSRSSKSPRVLSAAIQAKGISRNTAGAALRVVLAPGPEAALLRRCAAKAGWPEKPERDGERTALRIFLKSEGFSQETIDDFFDV